MTRLVLAAFVVLVAVAVADALRPGGKERAVSSPSAQVPEQRRTKVRRQIVRRGMGKGWLVFKTAGVRRRLAPITKNWETCSVTELEALLSRSKNARRAGDPALPA